MQGNLSRFSVDAMHDYFSLLHVPRRFALEPAALARAYNRAIIACHPDNHAGDPILAAQAQTMTAEINSAHQTLANPITRAQHLLQLEGYIEDESHTTQDTDFLLEHMQWREKIAAADQPARAAIGKQIAVKRQETIDALTQYFDQNWKDKGIPRQIQLQLTRLQFWDRLADL